MPAQFHIKAKVMQTPAVMHYSSIKIIVKKFNLTKLKSI